MEIEFMPNYTPIRSNRARIQYLRDYINERSAKDPNSECFLWGGVTDRQGYGRFYIKHLRQDVKPYFDRFNVTYAMGVHKLSFVLNGGKLTKSKPLCLHLCDVKNCHSMDHLCAGNHHENTQQAILAGNRPAGLSNTHSITADVAYDIRSSITNGESLYSISRRLDYDLTTIWGYKRQMIKDGARL